MGFFVQLSQNQLCTEFGVNIKKELATKYAALKIAFPEETFHALDAINIGGLLDSYIVKDFTNLSEEDRVNLSKVGITNDKIKKVAFLANYYAENHYLANKKENDKESELRELANQGIEFTIMASVYDDDQAKNLAFNHEWQRNSSGWKY